VSGQKCIVLDRDGVINFDSDEYIKSLVEWRPIPGSIEAMARLYKAGYRILVMTNQSGLARGYFSANELNAMHDELHRLLAALGAKVDAIFYCPHGPDDHCDCRKPRPGLFTRAAESLAVDLAGVPAIGDSFRDLEAARAVGACPVLVRTGKGERTIAKNTQQLADWNMPIFDDLSAAVDDLLSRD